jgi:hypothetical protein
MVYPFVMIVSTRLVHGKHFAIGQQSERRRFGTADIEQKLDKCR